MRHFTTLLVWASFSLAALPSSARGAQIIPVSQSRLLQGDANAFNRPNSMQHIEELIAPGFGPFVDTLVTQATALNAIARAEAFQNSTISPCTLFALGTMN